MGNYCPLGLGPFECPELSFRDEYGASNKTDCFPCTPGYWCNTTGMADETVSPCPAGHYCPLASEPVVCPAGTMRPIVAAANLLDCFDCTVGHFCPNGTININGIPCDEGYECPAGTSIPEVCRARRYCPPLTGEGLTCPGGSYCEGGTGNNPPLCYFPTYCPPGSNATSICDLGHMSVDHNVPRYDETESCRICPGGTYGDHPERLYCEPCPEGYYCPEGTAYATSNPCNSGYYCPANSSYPHPCPSGRYNKEERSTSVDECFNCPVNTYTNQNGQYACKPCGTSSWTKGDAGASICSCKGKYRAYHSSDGSCRCYSGYHYYDETGQNRTDDNSDQDCQPIVNERCTAGQIRRVNTRECVYPEAVDCNGVCLPQGSDGTLDSNTGM